MKRWSMLVISWSILGCTSERLVAGETAEPDDSDAADESTDVRFRYVLLGRLSDGSGVAFASCDEAGVGGLRLLVGDDADGDFVLDEDEVAGQADADCDQADENADWMVGPEEFGSFASTALPAGSWGLSAVEVLVDGAPYPWQPYDGTQDALRWTYGPVTLGPDTEVRFPGDAAQADGELQIFVGS